MVDFTWRLFMAISSCKDHAGPEKLHLSDQIVVEDDPVFDFDQYLRNNEHHGYGETFMTISPICTSPSMITFA
jgi:hypothetical protein